MSPTARNMPSWLLRSSASITNTFTSNRIPAMMLKLPMNRNSEPIWFEVSVAESRVSFFASDTTVVSPPGARS